MDPIQNLPEKCEQPQGFQPGVYLCENPCNHNIQIPRVTFSPSSPSSPSSPAHLLRNYGYSTGFDMRGVRPRQDYKIVKHVTGDCYKSYVWLDGEMRESYPSSLN